MRRQAKLAEVKMRNNLLKNKDFRKILKNYLRKNNLTPLSPTNEEDSDSRSPSGRLAPNGHFFIHSAQDKLMRGSPATFKMLPPRNNKETTLKFLPPFPI